MSEFFFAIFATIYIFLLLATCYYCANQVDPGQENFDTDNVDIPPPHLHLVDFANCLCQGFSNSDLPPS